MACNRRKSGQESASKISVQSVGFHVWYFLLKTKRTSKIARWIRAFIFCTMCFSMLLRAFPLVLQLFLRNPHPTHKLQIKHSLFNNLTNKRNMLLNISKWDGCWQKLFWIKLTDAQQGQFMNFLKMTSDDLWHILFRFYVLVVWKHGQKSFSICYVVCLHHWLTYKMKLLTA